MNSNFKNKQKRDKPWLNNTYENRLQKLWFIYKNYLAYDPPVNYSVFFTKIFIPDIVRFLRINKEYINRAYKFKCSSIYSCENLLTTIKLAIVDLFLFHDLVYCSNYTKMPENNNNNNNHDYYFKYEETDEIKKLKEKVNELYNKGEIHPLKKINDYETYPGKNDDNYLNDQYFSNKNNHFRFIDFGKYSKEVKYSSFYDVNNNLISPNYNIKNTGSTNNIIINNTNLKYQINNNSVNTNYRNQNNNSLKTTNINIKNDQNTKNEYNKMNISSSNNNIQSSEEKKDNNQDINCDEVNFNLIQSVNAYYNNNSRDNNIPNDYKNQSNVNKTPNNKNNIIKFNSDKKERIQPQSTKNYNLNYINNSEINNQITSMNNNKNENINQINISTQPNQNKNNTNTEIENEIEMTDDNIPVNEKDKSKLKNIAKSKEGYTKINSNNTNTNITENKVIDNMKNKDVNNIKINSNDNAKDLNNIYVLNTEGLYFDTEKYIKKCLEKKQPQYLNVGNSEEQYKLLKLFINDENVKEGNKLFMVLAMLSGINPKYYFAFRKMVYNSIQQNALFLYTFPSLKINKECEDLLVDGNYVKMELFFPFCKEYNIQLIFEFECVDKKNNNKIFLSKGQFTTNKNDPAIFILLGEKVENNITKKCNIYYINTDMNFLIDDKTRSKIRKNVENYIKNHINK